MENSTFLNDDLTRSNVIYNLSGADDFDSYHESDSDESDGEEIEGDGGDSDSTSDENDERDDVHIPSAQWFTTEDFTTNNVTENLDESSNFNLLSDDLFEGECFADKQAAINAIKASHIRDSRNYRVIKSDSTRYEAKCVVNDCPWKIRVIKRTRSGLFEITKLPA